MGLIWKTGDKGMQTKNLEWGSEWGFCNSWINTFVSVGSQFTTEPQNWVHSLFKFWNFRNHSGGYEKCERKKLKWREGNYFPLQKEEKDEKLCSERRRNDRVKMEDSGKYLP